MARRTFATRTETFRNSPAIVKQPVAMSDRNVADAEGRRRNLKDWATRSAAALDEVLDCRWRRLKRRFGMARTPQIQPYIGYGNESIVRLHGRVLTNPPSEPDFQNDRWWNNMMITWQRLASDEAPGVVVEARLSGKVHRSETDAEGYFYFCIDQPEDRPFWSQATLQIVDASGNPNADSTTLCDVLTAGSAARFAIVSDVDDTILHTGATNLITTAKLTIFGNAKTRAPLEGVSALYTLLQRDGSAGGEPINPIFYVSSSPWNLYDLLKQFMELNDIPRGPLLLRDLGFDRNKFFSEGHDHKLDKIRSLIGDHPGLPFLLFGDSGQEDARLYAAAAKEFGSQIKAIFIRDVDPGVDSRRDRKLHPFIARAERSGAPLHVVQDSAEAAQRLVDWGLLPSECHEIVQAAVEDDGRRSAGLTTP